MTDLEKNQEESIRLVRDFTMRFSEKYNSCSLEQKDQLLMMYSYFCSEALAYVLYVAGFTEEQMEAIFNITKARKNKLERDHKEESEKP